MTDATAYRVLVSDVLDRIERLRKLHRTGEYEMDYEDALNDLLDFFYGYCRTDLRLEEAP